MTLLQGERYRCLSLEKLEPRDWRDECEAIRKCGQHVYQFTRLDDGTFMVTHRFAGGKVEMLESGVRGRVCFRAMQAHHDALRVGDGVDPLHEGA